MNYLSFTIDILEMLLDVLVIMAGRLPNQTY